MTQRTHRTTDFEEKKFPLTVVLNNVSGPANVGSIFRLADAFNIEKLVFCGGNIDLESNRLKRTARATIRNVEFEEHENCVQFCENLKTSGYTLLALEITLDSIAVDSLNYSGFKKLALVLGNESSGMNEEVLKIADQKLHITMFGKNSSMNVAQAAGIALFEITKSLPAVSNK